MMRLLGAAVVTLLLSSVGAPLRADDQDAKAILERGIKALGGEAKLSKIEAATWKGKGKITIGGNESDITSQATTQGLDHYRGEFEGTFGGDPLKGVVILSGDKGWAKFNENGMELDKDAVANEKRNVYLAVIPVTLVPLKGKGFQIAPAGEETVNGSPAVGLKATAPDGKDFTLYFDKQSGLPVKLVAKVMGFMGGEEFNQETTYGSYKDFDGIKKATKIDVKRDGEKFVDQEITEFKVLDKVPASTFADPLS